MQFARIVDFCQVYRLVTCQVLNGQEQQRFFVADDHPGRSQIRTLELKIFNPYERIPLPPVNNIPLPTS
jgi:hypothetical protein